MVSRKLRGPPACEPLTSRPRARGQGGCSWWRPSLRAPLISRRRRVTPPGQPPREKHGWARLLTRAPFSLFQQSGSSFFRSNLMDKVLKATPGRNVSKNDLLPPTSGQMAHKHFCCFRVLPRNCCYHQTDTGILSWARSRRSTNACRRNTHERGQTSGRGHWEAGVKSTERSPVWGPGDPTGTSLLLPELFSRGAPLFRPPCFLPAGARPPPLLWAPHPFLPALSEDCAPSPFILLSRPPRSWTQAPAIFLPFPSSRTMETRY